MRLFVLFAIVMSACSSFAWSHRSEGPDPKEHLFGEFMERILATRRVDAPPLSIVNEYGDPQAPNGSVVFRGVNPADNKVCYILVTPGSGSHALQYSIFLAFMHPTQAGQLVPIIDLREDSGDYIYEQQSKSNKRKSTATLMLTNGLRIDFQKEYLDVTIIHEEPTKIRLPNLDILDDKPYYLPKKVYSRCVAPL